MAGRSNPVGNLIEGLSRPIMGVGGAGRAMSAAGQSFSKGASLALKLDHMFEEEEARLQNNMYKSQQMLQQGLQNAMNNQFRQQSANLQEKTFKANQDQRGITNQLNADKLTETKQYHKDTLAAKGNDTFKNAAKVWGDSVKNNTNENIIGVKELDREALMRDPAAAWAWQILQQGRGAQPTTQPVIEDPAQPGPVATNVQPVQPVTDAPPTITQPTDNEKRVEEALGLSPAQPEQPAVQPEPVLNLSSSSRKAFTVFDGLKNDPGKAIKVENDLLQNTKNAYTMVDGANAIIAQDPRAIMNPQIEAFYTAALASQGLKVAQSADNGIDHLPEAKQVELYKKAFNEHVMPSAYLDAKVSGTDGYPQIKYSVAPTSKLGAKSTDHVTWVNKSIEDSIAYGQRTISGQSTGARWFTAALESVFGFHGPQATKDAGIAAVKNQEVRYLHDYGVAPHATILGTLKDTMEPYFTKQKEGNFGGGWFGYNVDNANTPWDIPIKTFAKENGQYVETGKEKLGRFVVPNPVESQSSENSTLASLFNVVTNPVGAAIEAVTPDYKSSLDLIEKTKMSSPEQKQMMTNNLVELTDSLDAFRANKGYNRRNGEYEADVNADDVIKVKLIDLSTGKPEIVEMSVYGASVFGTILLQSKLEG